MTPITEVRTRIGGQQMDDFQKMLIDHVKRTEEYMASVNAHMVQARQARAEHDRSINCLKASFEAFRDEYGPMLKSAVTRRKWWNERVEETQKKTVLAVGWVLMLSLVYGLGHSLIFLINRGIKFLNGG